jgi:hypothetical protein
MASFVPDVTSNLDNPHVWFPALVGIIVYLIVVPPIIIACWGGCFLLSILIEWIKERCFRHYHMSDFNELNEAD